MTSFRVCKPRYVGTAFDGTGAAAYPGRWNAQGQRVAYTSDSPSLALLEIMVNASPRLLPSYLLISCSFDESLVIDIGALPLDWRRLVDPSWAPLQAIGAAWYESGKSAVLRVPSVVVPIQYNYLVNTRHPDFRKIKIYKPEAIEIDPRLIKP